MYVYVFVYIVYPNTDNCQNQYWLLVSVNAIIPIKIKISFEHNKIEFESNWTIYSRVVTWAVRFFVIHFVVVQSGCCDGVQLLSCKDKSYLNLLLLSINNLLRGTVKKIQQIVNKAKPR